MLAQLEKSALESHRENLKIYVVLPCFADLLYVEVFVYLCAEFQPDDAKHCEEHWTGRVEARTFQQASGLCLQICVWAAVLTLAGCTSLVHSGITLAAAGNLKG